MDTLLQLVSHSVILLKKTMINLIPPKARKSLTHEYWARVVSVWSFLIIGICIVSTLLLVPLFVLLRAQTEALALTNPLHTEGSSEGETKEATKAVKRANAFVVELGKPLPVQSMADILTTIAEAAPEGVRVRNYNIVRESDNSIQSVEVQGNASSRDALSAFRAALERSPRIKSATLPLSDLARERDLPFIVTITFNSESETP